MLQISKTSGYYSSSPYSQPSVQCFCCKFGLLSGKDMTKIPLEKIVKELNSVKIVVTSRYWRSFDHLMKLFSGHKPCYNG